MHKKIVKRAKESVTRSALNDCSLLEEWERKQQLQDALTVAASRYADKGNAVTQFKAKTDIQVCVNRVSGHMGYIEPWGGVQGIPAAVRKDHVHV